MAVPARTRILIGVTGSIAAYKAADVVSALRKEGHPVTVIMTESATRLVAPITFETLSNNAVITDLWTSEFSHRPDHVMLKHEARLLAVLPATANILAKAAHGLADDALSTTLLSVTCPILFAPAMNTDMWNNPVVQRNLNTLHDLGHTIIEPAAGELACGDEGIGKLAPVDDLLAAIRKLLK